MKKPLFALLSAGAFFAAPSASAQAFIDFGAGETIFDESLPGTVTQEGWNDLTTSRIPNNNATGGPSDGGSTTRPYGSHNNTAGWYQWAWDPIFETYFDTGVPSTIASNLGSEAGDSTFWKSSGYGFVAGSSVHQGFPGFAIAAGGNFVIDGIAIPGLETLIFQIQATDRGGNSTTLGSVFHSLPTVTFGSTTLAADYSLLTGAIYDFSAGFGGQNMQFWAFQWDLSTYTFDGSESFSIDWTGLTNSGVFGMQLNQGDTFVQMIPEPSSGLLILAGLGVLAALRNRKRVASSR